MKLVVSLILMVMACTALALNNGVARTPPMGWLAWERFACNTDCANDPENCISEHLFLDMGKKLVELGFKDVGYEFVNIDDCWAAKDRDSNNQLQADPIRFPNGIKSLADQLHSMGLKLGIYADYGSHTCGGYPGSIDHMELDAQTFADWGVDMLKLDGCNSKVTDMKTGYPQMTQYLNKTGRPIVFSCSWPDYERGSGLKPDYKLIAANCNLWRNYNDISDSWDSVLGIINYYASHQDDFQPVAGPGNWNDPDMLIIGDFSLSLEQAKSQFAIWSIFAAPLLMSTDLRSINPDYAAGILQNQEVIAIDQDPMGVQGRLVANGSNYQVFSRPLQNNTYAAVLFNTHSFAGPRNISVELKQLGINSTAANARDLFAHKELGTFQNMFHAMVDPDGVVMVKLTPM
ncbi:alpha-N-acetylgalactosaminidase-like [Dysidea avara]|uniref:alpha-N-acetylgalactosaminidase-like n=1 Tax=Dysidea avara TaxID=196820 RepID=UPI003326F366